MRFLHLLPLVALLCVGVTVALKAGQLEPPSGPITATGRFGPRIDICSLPGSSQAVHVISQPGSYYLSADVMGISGRAGIRVDASNVTIDLNGFSLIGVPGTLLGISRVTPDIDEPGFLVVKNGGLYNWDGGGVGMNAGHLVRLENLCVEDCDNNGISIGVLPATDGKRSAIILNCSVASCSQVGIATNREAVIKNCTVVNCGTRGINTTVPSVVENCLSSGNVADDIFVTNGLVRGCVGGSITGSGGTTFIDNHSL